MYIYFNARRAAAFRIMQGAQLVSAERRGRVQRAFETEGSVMQRTLL
jgi:hypothetical protein